MKSPRRLVAWCALCVALAHALGGPAAPEAALSGGAVEKKKKSVVAAERQSAPTIDSNDNSSRADPNNNNRSGLGRRQKYAATTNLARTRRREARTRRRNSLTFDWMDTCLLHTNNPRDEILYRDVLASCRRFVEDAGETFITNAVSALLKKRNFKKLRSNRKWKQVGLLKKAVLLDRRENGFPSAARMENLTDLIDKWMDSYLLHTNDPMDEIPLRDVLASCRRYVQDAGEIFLISAVNGHLRKRGFNGGWPMSECYGGEHECYVLKKAILIDKNRQKSTATNPSSMQQTAGGSAGGSEAPQPAKETTKTAAAAAAAADCSKQTVRPPGISPDESNHLIELTPKGAGAAESLHVGGAERSDAVFLLESGPPECGSEAAADDEDHYGWLDSWLDSFGPQPQRSDAVSPPESGPPEWGSEAAADDDSATGWKRLDSFGPQPQRSGALSTPEWGSATVWEWDEGVQMVQ